ncbi:MAG: hypothetical protein KBD07_02425 [Candidatus Omnitrophica bacterium]|jgi:hypothetical protein|nr:hypothetical protein [Candidatus Omnitrophota bacterium]
MKHFLHTPALVLSVLLFSTSSYAITESRSASSAAVEQPTAKPDKALRIYLKTGGKKTYVRGYQWMTLDLNRKISLIESARRGAAKMNAVMTRPAETYVAEINKFFQDNPTLMQMEVGQVIQGIAISIKDWEDGGSEI